MSRALSRSMLQTITVVLLGSYSLSREITCLRADKTYRKREIRLKHLNFIELNIIKDVEYNFRVLEIKPFGLGSRIRDMEAESHN